MQNLWAPAASAARACSRICSGSIIACIGVSDSAYRDWAQKPQSSAQPPDFALTSEHMSVESPKFSWRTSQARSTSAITSSGSVSEPSSRASSKLISGGIQVPSFSGVRRKARNDAGQLWWRRMDAVARIVSGRRSKYLVLVVWVIALLVLTPLGSKLGDVTNSNTETFLPKSAESTAVLKT